MKFLEEWIKTFIKLYRQKYSSISVELLKHLPRFNDFSPVCQLELIQFDSPLRQILLISRFKDESDLEINIHDPVPNEEILDKLAEITNNRKWEKLLEPKFLRMIPDGHNEERHYKYYLEAALINSYQNGQLNKTFDSTHTGIIERSSPHLTDTEPNIFSYWLINGSISDINTNELVESIFNDVVNNKEEIENIEENEEVEGFLSFIYPPIWLDEIPDFKEQALKSTEQHKKLVLTLKYREPTILIYKDGGIGIIENNKSNARRILNEIMGTLVFHNIPAYSIGEYDLTYAVWKLPDFSLQTTSSPDFSIRSFQWIDRNNYSKVMYPYSWRNRVQSTELEKAINLGPEFIDNIGIDLMYLYLEAFTDLREKHYVQSFVLSWVIIERLINECWEISLKEKGLSNNRVQKLSESSDWTASIKIETINLLGLINDEEYRELSNLRKTRNDFIHKVKEISENDARKCYQWCNKLIKRKLHRETQKIV